MTLLDATSTVKYEILNDLALVEKIDVKRSILQNPDHLLEALGTAMVALFVQGDQSHFEKVTDFRKGVIERMPYYRDQIIEIIDDINFEIENLGPVDA